MAASTSKNFPDAGEVSPDDSPFRYSLLVGHRRSDGSFKSSQELRMQYLTLTDRLIYSMTDGFTVTAPDGSSVTDAIPDSVIYLDKSARPVAWLAAEAWDRLSPREVGGAPAPRPAFHFLNIDRMQWVNTVDPDGRGLMDVTRIDQTIIRSLRSVFVDPRDKRAGLTEEIDTAPAELDGQTIMVVDEVFSSGRTIDIATKLVQRAFPTASVGGAHWMGGLVARGAAVGNADIPVWYDESSELGRGIGNRQVGGGTNREPGNITQRLGAWFLSTRLAGPDPAGVRLRRELTELARHPDVPIRPAVNRPDTFERLEWLNGGLPAKEVLARVAEILGTPLG